MEIAVPLIAWVEIAAVCLISAALATWGVYGKKTEAQAAQLNVDGESVVALVKLVGVLILGGIVFEFSRPLLAGSLLEFEARSILEKSVKEPDNIAIQRVVAKDLHKSTVCFYASHEAGLNGKKTSGVFAVDVPNESVVRVSEEWTYTQICSDER